MNQENLKLWEAVRTPDPAHTKSFSRGGGFKGTATNPTYLIRLATEHWGPMGGSWGVEIVSERVVQGAPILGKDGITVIGHEQVHVCQIKLRHPGGAVPAFGQTQFVGVNKYGPFTDEEAPKKSLTDALTKALSWLGFAADIHLGMWDDHNYVNSVRRLKAEERDALERDADKGDEGEKGGLPEGALAKHVAAVLAAKTQSELKQARDEAKQACEKAGDKASYEKVLEVVRERAQTMTTGKAK